MADPYFSLVVLCYRSGHSIIPFVEKMRQALARCNFTWELALVGNYIEGAKTKRRKCSPSWPKRFPTSAP